MKVLVIENATSAPAALFGDWLRDKGADLTVVTPDNVPDTPDGYDLVVTLGSPHGAYEDLPWIHRQRDFLRAAAEADHPVIGICFGAQLLADAIGGLDDGGLLDQLNPFAAAKQPAAGLADLGAAAHVHAGDLPLAVLGETGGEAFRVLAPDRLHEPPMQLPDAEVGVQDIAHRSDFPEHWTGRRKP